MLFINEFMSDQDVSATGVMGLREEKVGKWHPGAYKFHWTRNETKDTYLFFIRNIQTDSRTGLMVEPTSFYEFLFHFEDKSYEIVIERNSTSSSLLKDNPFLVVWSIDAGDQYSEKLIENLKEALVVYGYKGMQRQVPNTVVSFGLKN